MRILFVADGRSPTAQGFIRGVASRGHQVHLVSTFPCPQFEPLASLRVIPAAFTGLAGAGGSTGGAVRFALRRLRGLVHAVRYVFGPLTLQQSFHHLAQHVRTVDAQLVHALRIPFEGMLASCGDLPVPLILTIWGNDLTLHAPAARSMALLTRRALQRASGLMADTRCDLHRAIAWGYAAEKPTLTVPGGGGIDLPALQQAIRAAPPLDLPPASLRVINPRGMRAYVRNDTFFQAVPRILRHNPAVQFTCPDMDWNPRAQALARAASSPTNLFLLPKLSQGQLWRLMTESQVCVSPSTHDGTPNTLLEAFACGCFPVVGDLEPLREWITPGVNGLVIDPADPDMLAGAVTLALENPGLRKAAAEYNLQLVQQRAARTEAMRMVEALYLQLIGK